MKSGLLQKMMHMKARFILSTKSVVRIMKELRAQRLSTSNTWKGAMEQIHISEVCWEGNSDEFKAT